MLSLEPVHVVSINSHVCYGHVGAQATLLPLQRAGIEVSHVPTVVFSNHPAYGGHRGDAVPSHAVADLIDGLRERGVLAACNALHSGYMGLAETADIVAETVADLRRHAKEAIYCCDPVLGDAGRVYVRDGIVEAMRDRLVPMADIATPNRDELGWLTGQQVTDLDSTIAACRALRQSGAGIVVATSAEATQDFVATVAVAENEALVARTQRYDDAPFGTGDLFTALFLGRYLLRRDMAAALAHAAAATHDIVAASVKAKSRELLLVAAQEALVAPRASVTIETIA